MEKINFENSPSTKTPINADNLNQIQSNVETEINLLKNKTKVLWTNPSPTANFYAQTITLSSSDYDYLMLNYLTGDNQADSEIIKKGQNFYMTKTVYDSSTDKVFVYTRSASYANDTTYNVGTAKLNGQERAWLNIPQQIVGIKL